MSRVVDTITGEMIDTDSYRGVWYSASLLKDFNECKAKAFARLTKQKYINPGIFLINGSAIHSGIEHFLKERKDPIEEYHRYFSEECDKQGLKPSDSFAEVKRDAEKMLSAAKVSLGMPGFIKNLDPDLVEKKFKIGRAGRIFTGKLDLIYFKNLEQKRYNITDWKSGKTAPNQLELDHDIQFNLYPWATFHDPELPTHGIWPEYSVWYHLRGKNVGIDKKTGKTTRKESEKKWKFDFPTVSTQESVAQIFKDTIDPICDEMETETAWRRNRTEACARCNWFNKTTKQCGAEIPSDGLAERNPTLTLLDMNLPVRTAA